MPNSEYVPEHSPGTCEALLSLVEDQRKAIELLMEVLTPLGFEAEALTALVEEQRSTIELLTEVPTSLGFEAEDLMAAAA